MSRTRELRRQVRALPMSTFELRQLGDSLTFQGYASTFGNGYDMGWYTEVVNPGAFTKTLSENPDVRFLVNHDGLPLARTKSGTLTLTQDSVGLFASASLDPSDPDVASLVPKINRGDVDSMSFGFQVIRQEWSPDYEQRNLIEVALADGDVSVVTFPANPATSASLRSLRSAARRHPAAIRSAYRALQECREGKVLSQANVDLLTSVLEALAIMDGHVDQVDADLDAAQSQLATLLGVADPDPADDESPDTPDLDPADAGSQGADDPPAETDSSRSLHLALATAEALRLRQNA